MMAPEWKPALLVCIGGLCYGAIQPLCYFCLGRILPVYFIDNHREIKSQTRIYSFAFLSFAVFAFITNVFQHYYFGIMGKRLIKTLFGKILTFEVEWFDQEKNNGGAMCARLATDATRVKILAADYL